MGNKEEFLNGHWCFELQNQYWLRSMFGVILLIRFGVLKIEFSLHWLSNEVRFLSDPLNLFMLIASAKTNDGLPAPWQIVRNVNTVFCCDSEASRFCESN